MRVLPSSESFEGLGRTKKSRNYFWYQRNFKTSAKKQMATLVVNKAQFDTAVWLNGRKIGEHIGCFTAGRFDITNAIPWNGENNLIIRIGALMPEQEQFISIKELSARLQMHPQTIYRLTCEKKITSIKIGGAVRCNFNQFLNSVQDPEKNKIIS